jgi:signal transduction histidine kinase
MTVIGVLSDLLRDEVTGEALLDLSSMAESADLACMVIESLQSLARLEQGVPEPAAASVIDMASLALDVASRPALRGQVDVDSSGPLPVRADGTALRRALNDLLLNARSLSDPNRSLRLCTEREKGRCAILVVAPGAVVPAEARRAVFELFCSADLRAQRVAVAATGLAYAGSVASGFGGTVVFEDMSDGVQIRFELPDVPG